MWCGAGLRLSGPGRVFHGGASGTTNPDRTPAVVRRTWSAVTRFKAPRSAGAQRPQVGTASNSRRETAGPLPEAADPGSGASADFDVICTHPVLTGPRP